MAINQTDKALNLCTRLMAAATKVMEGVEELARLKDEKESAGVDFTAAPVETALSGSALKHANGTDFNNVLSSGAALKGWLETNFHDDILQKVRP
jgi:hypothetical protein